jgi:hypothetical protein
MPSRMRTWNGNVPEYKTISGKKFVLITGPLFKAEAAKLVQFYREGGFSFCRTFKFGKYWYIYQHIRNSRTA